MGGTTDTLAIDLRDVAKRYRGRVDALKGINMQVRRGEIFGFLGPNGAGKSTLVKIMMTIVRPTRAEGTVLGRAIGHKPTLGRMGYLPENHRFPRYLTGRQVIEFFGAMSKVNRVMRRKRAAELIDLVNMRDAADRKVGTYSKGMAQRIGLAQAMVNDPDLILLDEPTDGVDPVGRREIRDVLMRLRDRGTTVFINSHLLSELEMISDRVAILVAGRVASQGTIGDLTQSRQHYQIEVANHEAPVRALPDLLAATPLLIPAAAVAPGGPAVAARSVARGSLASGILLEIEGAVIRVGTTDAAAIQPLLDTLRGARFVVQRVQVIRPSLEDLFIETVGAKGETPR